MDIQLEGLIPLMKTQAMSFFLRILRQVSALIKPQKSIKEWIAEQIECSELFAFLILSWIQIS